MTDAFVRNVRNAHVNEYLDRIAMFRVHINSTFGICDRIESQSRDKMMRKMVLMEVFG